MENPKSADFITALIFAVMPVNVELVAWVRSKILPIYRRSYSIYKPAIDQLIITVYEKDLTSPELLDHKI